MKKLFTLLAMLLVTVISVSAAFEPVRITVVNPTVATGSLTIDVLSSSGGSLSPAVSISKGTKTTDNGGVLSFLLDATTEVVAGGFWTTNTHSYNKDYLVRVTFNGVVLSIERMEVVYAKQGLFGALVEPNEIAVGPVGYVLTSDGTTNDWKTTSSISKVGTISEGTWQGSPVAIAYGGTGATTKSGAFDALSPMTTLGDMIYGATAGTATRMGGNATTTKMFLSQTGTGSASAAPIWAALVDGDIPNDITINLATRATNVAGGAANQIPYQSAANTTLFSNTGASGQIIVNDGSKPVWVAMSGDVTISSAGATTIGASKVTSSMINDLTIENGDIATAAGIVVTKLSTGGANQVILGNGTANAWGALTDAYIPNSITIDLSTRATNIAGGLAGSIPYQNAVNATSLLGIGTAGQILRVNAGAPAWSDVSAAMADLTATDLTLTINGTGAYDGSAARTVGLNLSNTNTWLATQTFQTILPSATNTYNLGAEATSFANVYANGITVNPYGAATQNTGFIVLKELAASGSNYVGFRAPDALLNNTVYEMPSAPPIANGQMLVSQINGVMSWASLDPDILSIASLPAIPANSGYFLVVAPGGGWMIIQKSDARTSIDAEPAFTKGNLISTDITVGTGTGRLVGGNATLTIVKGDLVSGTDPDDVITVTGGTGAVLGGGVTLKVKKATSTSAGYLSQADWVSFTGKLNYDQVLADIAAMDLNLSAGSMLVSDGTTFLLRTPVQVKTSLALQNVDNTTDLGKPISTLTQTALNGKQPLDDRLTDIADFGVPADGMFMVGDGTQWVLEGTGTARASLGLGSMAVQNSGSVAITGGTINGTTIGATTPSTAQFTIIDVKPVGTAAGATGSITLRELVANDYHGVTLKAPDAITADYSIVLPVLASTATNQILKTNNASGQLEWVTFDKSAVGLDQVDNLKQIPWSFMGDASKLKVATLDADGYVTDAQLPATYPAVVTVADNAALIAISGAANTLYIKQDDNTVWVWTGEPNQFSNISPGLVLGELSTTAFDGYRGKIAYDHSQIVGIGPVATGNPHRTSKADIGLGNVDDVSINSWAGSTNLNKVGTITTGVWNADIILDAKVDNTLTITAGSINGTPIGAGTASTGRFSTIQLPGGANNITLQAPAGTASYTLTLPSSGPAVSQFLINDPTTPGTLRWANALPIDVGLDRVDNTNDLEKPISTLTQAALDGKQNYDADLTVLAGVTLGSDQMLYTVTGGALAALNTTDYGRQILSMANPAALQAHLSLAIATNVQAWDTQLDQIAAMVPIVGSMIVGGAGSTWQMKTPTEVLTAIGAQPIDANLTNLALMGTAADKMLYSIGEDSWSETPTTAFGRGMLNYASATAARASLGVDYGAGGVQPYDATLTSIATLGTAQNIMLYSTAVDSWAETITTVYGRSLLNTVDGSAVRTLIGAVIGTNVQAFDSDLSDIAGFTHTDGNIIVSDGSNWVLENGATARTSLGLTIGTDVQAYNANTSTLGSDISLTTEVSGILPSANGGTGINNAGRTLTINTNSGTISFTSATTLTVAAVASVSGTNTGDETASTIRTKLGVTTLSGSNTGDQTSIVGITGTIAQFNTALTDGDFATGGGTATGSNTGDNAVNTLYSGLDAAKANLSGATFSGTIQGTSAANWSIPVTGIANFASIGVANTGTGKFTTLESTGNTTVGGLLINTATAVTATVAGAPVTNVYTVDMTGSDFDFTFGAVSSAGTIVYIVITAQSGTDTVGSLTVVAGDVFMAISNGASWKYVKL